MSCLLIEALTILQQLLDVRKYKSRA